MGSTATKQLVPAGLVRLERVPVATCFMRASRAAKAGGRAAEVRSLMPAWLPMLLRQVVDCTSRTLDNRLACTSSLVTVSVSKTCMADELSSMPDCLSCMHLCWRQWTALYHRSD